MMAAMPAKPAVTRAELLSIIGFLQRTRGPAVDCLGVRSEDPIWNMVIYLIERDLHNRLVTVTSLAAAADIPYTTALRRIEEMFERGLVERTPRGSSGKQFAITPTEALRTRFVTYAGQIKMRVAETVGQSADDDSFFFGAAYNQARIISPPREGSAPKRPLDTVRCLFKNQPIFLSLVRLRTSLELLIDTPINIQLRGYDEQLQSILENSEKSVSDFDILSVPYAWLGELVCRGALLPLGDLMKDAGVADHLDFYPVAWEAGQFRDELYTLPYEVAAELLCYRKSILAKAEIDPPKTLDGVLRAARRLTDRNRDFYGIAWCGKRGTPLAQTFLQLLADFDQPPLTFPRHLGHVDLSAAEDPSLSACLETEAAFAAAEHLKALLPFSLPEVLETGWDERLYAYATGRVALAYNWSVRIGELQSSPGSPLADTGFLAHPSAFPRPGTAPLGGFGLAIPANLAPDRIDGAVRMLRWLTSPTVTKLAALNGGSSSPRITVSRDTDVAESNLVIPVIDRLARSDLIQRWSNPPIPHYSVLLKALGNELHEMLLGRTSIAHALESAQKRVNNVLGVEKG